MDALDPPCLPDPGRIACSLCHPGTAAFDETRTAQGNWRITANPLSWGNPRPEVLVLGFSKGPSQAGELRRLPHDDIPYRKGRTQVGKILAHVGLLPPGDNAQLRSAVDRAIADRSGRFGWGSLVRCTVERYDPAKRAWVGSGGMIDQFMATGFGQRVSSNCASRFLRELPPETSLIVMFGLGAGRQLRLDGAPGDRDRAAGALADGQRGCLLRRERDGRPRRALRVSGRQHPELARPEPGPTRSTR
jgi:hypothetical protein